VVVLRCADASGLNIETFGIDEYLLPNYLVDLLRGGLGLGARLILVAVFDCGGFGELKALVGVVKLPLIGALPTVEVGRTLLLRVLGGGGLCDFDLGRRVLLQCDPRAHAREHRRYFGRVLRGFRSEVLVLRLLQLGTVCAEPIS